jgi:hypothetical protein
MCLQGAVVNQMLLAIDVTFSMASSSSGVEA